MTLTTSRDLPVEATAASDLPRRWLWLIPFGSAVALVVGNGPISVFAFGVFIKPLEAEFGWSRASISAGLSMCGLFSALSLPLVGGLMDRSVFGGRCLSPYVFLLSTLPRSEAR